MAKTVRDSKLDSRAARAKLSQQQDIFWKAIDQGLHIGYYKGKTGSAWKARFRNSSNKYVKMTVGVTDDILDADGIKILSFYQAQEKAREWFAKQSRIDTGGIDTTKEYTINEILDEYLEWFKTEKKSYSSTKATIETHIRKQLGTIKINNLSSHKVTQWRNNLANTPAKLRSGIGKEANYCKEDQTPEILRRRKSTANRILTVLKAALNYAYREGKYKDSILSDNAWKTVKPFKGVDMPTTRYISLEEIKRLVNACDNDFRPLVQAALFTGCRYGELCKLVCGDYHADTGTVLIKESKSGKPRRVVLTKEGQDFFLNITTGKTSGDIAFSRGGKLWAKSHQTRRLKEACERAKIIPAISFHVLRHTHASLLATSGTPLQVIAEQLGHSDTRICERHYAHLRPSYVADTIRANMPDFGIVEDSNVVRIG